MKLKNFIYCFLIIIFAISCNEPIIEPEMSSLKTSELKAVTIGTNYYVSTKGSNSNPGTEALPFLTLAYTESKLHAGDSVIVENGIYSGSGNALYLYNVRSGSAESPITWKARNKGGAIMDGQNKTVYGIVVHAAYVNIEGFVIKNMTEKGILVQSDGDNCNFRDLQVHNIGRMWTITITGLCAFGLAEPSNIVIERCSIHDIGRFGQGENGADYSSYSEPTKSYWQGHDHGVYLHGGTNITVKNNLFYNMLRGYSMQIYDGEGVPANNVSFINNTCENGNPYLYNAHFILASTINNCLIANNIFKDQYDYGMRVSTNTAHTMTNVLITKNMTSGGNGITVGGSHAGVTITGNYNSTDPLFVNEANHDYTLQSSSPANTSGYASGLTTDYLNNIRTSINIGAFASSGSSPAVVPAPTSYYSIAMSATATKNDCGTGYTGSIVTFTVSASKFSSNVSQIDADNKALADLNTNKQTYANANGSCIVIPPTVYYNIEMSATATKNDCGTGYTGSLVTYTVPAKYYSSTISQADANNIATNRLRTNTQAYANAYGTCIVIPSTVYYSIQMSATATKNDCGTGYKGSLVTYTIPAKYYSSTVSQDAANNIAITRLATNKQAYANANGTCTRIVKRNR